MADLTEGQEQVLHAIQHAHERAMLTLGGYNPTGHYFRKDGTPIGTVTVASTAGDDWVSVLTFPIVTVDDVHASVLSMTADAVSADGSEQVLMVVFSARNGYLMVPVAYELVGDAVVYGVPDLDVEGAAGDVVDRLRSAWNRHGGWWRHQVEHEEGFEDTPWPADPREQWRACAEYLELLQLGYSAKLS